MWELARLSPAERRDGAIGVREAIEEIDKGEIGRFAEDVSAELRAELNRPE